MKLSDMNRDDLSPLGKFLYDEMTDNLFGTTTELARYTTLSRQTIDRLMKPNGPMPDLASLITLATRLSINVCILVTLVAPDAAMIAPDDELTARRLKRLHEKALSLGVRVAPGVFNKKQ